MADGDKLIKYITQQVVNFIDAPRKSRSESSRLNRRKRERWSNKWFGMVPLALSFWYKNVRKKRRKT